MPIQLEGISFNFDPVGLANEGLSLRQDAARLGTFAADVVKGDFFFDEFVITRARTTDAPIEIALKLGCPDSSVASAEIRAIASEQNLLGNVPNTRVDFDPSGRSTEIIVTLPDGRLPTGVQSHSVIWEWQFRTEENREWIPFKTTRQRVYCGFGTPRDPWGEGHEPLWPEVLDYACKWAQGAQDEPTAATMISKEVFRLGQQGKVIYAQGSTYANATFDCAAFLLLLKNGVGTAQSLNCDDCATVVSTFGNILGCDLNQSEMGSDFETNFVQRIGISGWVETGFDRHAVAWKGDCERNDPLYDACLRLDGDGDPRCVDENLPFQPCNLIFGTGNSQQNDYKFCLVNPIRPCEPQSQFKTRRKLGKSYLTERRINDVEYLSIFKIRYGFDTWPDDTRIGLNVSRPSLVDFLKDHLAFVGFKILETNRFDAADLESVDQVILLFPAPVPRRIMEVYVYVSAASANPNDFLLQLLAQFNSPQNHREPDLEGAMVFADQDKTMHVIKRHQFVGLVRNVGTVPVPTAVMVRALREYFNILGSE